jgi:hypothetical protein
MKPAGNRIITKKDEMKDLSGRIITAWKPTTFPISTW